MDKYVSDALERILDATPVRNQVSQQVCEHLQEYGPLISSVLGQSAQYFSSKCMGYPSIWFLFRVCDIPQEQWPERIESVMQSLLFSLSTSIADDFIDGDERVGDKDMYVFYIMMLAIAERSSGEKSRLDNIKQTCKGLYDSIIQSKIAQAKGENGDEYVSTDRIGSFFAMIARDFVDALPQQNDHNLIEATRYFGRICCLIDDAIDFTKDVEIQGENIIFEVMDKATFEQSKSDVQIRINAALQVLDREYSTLSKLLESIWSQDCQQQFAQIRLDIVDYITTTMNAQ
ncbi:hypothetical protein [Pseudoalteromonas maricaloris]|uniref:hypothetical protein n=1 Tax=Pseudoalteromonas maricaloris TaxID=184924 RepID=UPI000299DAA7|nr:hypothetical protein [Pseudoalteromonas flavipulchra]